MPQLNLTSEIEQSLREACGDFRARLRLNESYRAETVFAEYPHLAEDAEAALEILYTEYVTREELGQGPTADDLFARFPQWQDRLKRLLGVHAGMVVVESRTAPGDTLRTSESKETGRFGEFSTDIGVYETLELIGRGGMGLVYKARHRTLKRLVALKRLLVGEWASDEEGRRFRMEAETVSRLDHPNIVKLFEVGEHGGQPYLILELVAGGSLAKLLNRGPLPALLAAELLEALARALQHAHERGILHRDLKPANILLQTAEGDWPIAPDDPWPQSAIPKLADFGLAKRLSASYGPSETGKLVGTPAYLAPERIDGKNDDPSSDIYSLGAVLYECLTGRPPFLADSPLATLCQVRDRDPVPLLDLRPDCPRDLATICLKCLHKDPRRRYHTSAALADDLARYRRGETIRARPAGIVESLFKWARRRPAVAALGLSLGTVAAIAFVVITLFWLRTNAALKDTEQARQAESTARRRAEDNLFAKQLLLARRAWEDLKMVEAQRNLEECDPKLRDQEWSYLWEACQANLVTVPGSCRGGVFSPDSSKVAIFAESQVRVVEVKTGRQLYTVPLATDLVAFSPQGDQLLVCLKAKAKDLVGPSMHRHDAETGALLGVRMLRPNLWGLSPCGRFLISRTEPNGEVILEEALTGKTVANLGPTKHTLASCQISQADTRCLTVNSKFFSVESTLRVWDTESECALRTVEFPKKARLIAALRPDGQRLALLQSSGVDDSVVTIQDAESGQELLRFTCSAGQAHTIYQILYSPNGRWLATFSNDTVIVWDAQTGREYRTLRGHTGWIQGFQFSPDSRLLASTGLDALRIWRIGAAEPE